MEPHQQSYELTATSSLTSHQLEVYRLFQMCGVNMTNEKFKVTFHQKFYCCAISKPLSFKAIWELVSLNIPTSYIMDLLRNISQQSEG